VAPVIEAVELRRVALPLVTPFRAAWGESTVRDALLVRLLGDGGEGWGECVAMSEPLYTSEWVDGAALVLRSVLVPRLLAGLAVDVVRGHPMAKAALEMAGLDLSLRAAGRSLASSLGVVASRVPVGVSVGLMPSEGALVDAVARYVVAGYTRVKLKVEPGADVTFVGAVRSAFPDLALQVDANGSYAADPRAARVLDRFGLLLIEQPLAEDDLAGHASLASSMETPICLDESITSASAAALALDLGACSVVCVKPGRVGGLAEAVRIHDLCLERNVALWCGGMLETGIGRAANLALAALPGFTLPGDISASDRYFAQDLTPPFVLVDGCLEVPDGPGLGVTVLPDVVEALTTSVEVLRP
jgi:O-succinylbenzoate synthase